MFSFLGTIFLGVQNGLIIAISVSLLIVVYEAVYPHTSVVGRLPGTSIFRNVKQYPDVERYDGVLIVRINTPIFFANAVSVRDKVRKYKRVAQQELNERNAGNVEYIVWDLSAVSHIDTTALHVLQDMYVTQKNSGVQMCFCNPCAPVMEKLIKSAIVAMVGREHIFASLSDAVHWCLTDLECRTCRVPAIESALSVVHGDF
jgi:sulfate transporter 4